MIQTIEQLRRNADAGDTTSRNAVLVINEQTNRIQELESALYEIVDAYRVREIHEIVSEALGL